MKPKKSNVNPNAFYRAIVGSMKIKKGDVERQVGIIHQSIEDLIKAGHEAQMGWRNLAEASNMAIELSSVGIGKGADADVVIQQAQEALAYVRQERLERGTWALRAEDRIEIRLRFELFRDFHKIQLESCSYFEFDKAFDRMQRRLEQARAGNASPNDVVVLGLIKEASK